MVQDRLTGLALMHAHREMELDLEKIVDLFANLHPRRTVSYTHLTLPTIYSV